MSDFKGIPVVTTPARSGEKYVTAQGTTAIKDGIKAGGAPAPLPAGRKPRWLRAPMPGGDGFDEVRRTVREHRLATVCEEAKCPNIGECWNAGTATLMLMGEVCTRACRFCAVDTGNPRGWLDARGARERGAQRRAHGAQVRRADLGGSRRPARRRRRALRGLRARDQARESRDRRRGADAGFPGRAARTSRPWWTAASRCSRRTSRRCGGSRTRCAIRARPTSRRSRCSRTPSGTARRCSPRPA